MHSVVEPRKDIRPRQSGRVCLLVLGMHRSGTSALTRTLSLLGAELPKKLMPPVKDNNDAGFWEPQRLVNLHDELLKESGSRWDDWRAFDVAALPPDRLAYYKGQIKRLITEEYDDAALFVIKDPRLCRLVPLYEEVLEDLGIDVRFLLPSRNPLAVVASLAKRDGMTEGFAGLLWLRHVLDAEVATRRKPRCVLSYETFLDDWRAAVGRMREALNISWPRDEHEVASEIGGFLSRDLQHHAPDLAALERDPEIASWIKDAYSALSELATSGERAEARKVFDRVRKEFEAAAPIFGRATFPEIAARETRLLAARQDAERSAEQRQAEIARLEAKGATDEERIKVLAADRDRKTRQVKKLSGELETAVQAQRSHLAEIDRGMAQLALLSESRQHLQNALDRVKGELADARQELALLSESRQHLQSTLDRAKDDLADARQEAAALKNEVHKSRQNQAALTQGAKALLRSRTWRYGSSLRRALFFPSVASLYLGRSVRLRPLKDVDGNARSRVAEWTITGDDPQFELLGAWGSWPLGPGHYKITLELPGGQDDLILSCLYPDIGTGYAEAEGVDLQFRPIRRNRTVAAFSLHNNVGRLRFDPTTYPCKLTIGRASVRRLSRFEYYLTLMHRVGSRHIRGPRSLWDAGGRALKMVAREGVRGFAARLRQADAAEVAAARAGLRWNRRIPDSDSSATLPVRRFEGSRTHVEGGKTVLVAAHLVGDELFGSERSFLDILDGFRALDLNVVVSLPRHVESYTEEVRRRANAVFVFDYRFWSNNEISNAAVRVFEDLISGQNVDAVHVNTITVREPLIAARNRGISSAVHVRELIQEDRWLAQIIGETPDGIVEQTLRRADWVIANSEITAKAFRKEGQTFVVPNTVDLDEFDMPNDVAPDHVKFGIISSNIPKKGISDVIELARACETAVPQARFLVIGPETDLTRELQAKKARGQVPQTVEFAGYARSPRDAVGSVNVVLCFSHFAESFGRTALEGMAARRPVIAYRSGALPELVADGTTGFLVPHRRPLEAVAAVEALCSDHRRIAEMGAAARRVAEERFSRKAYAERLKEAYAEILRDNGTRVAPRNGEAAGNLPQPLSMRNKDEKLRIAYFCWHFPVPSETFVLNELRHLVAQGHDVIVFCRQSPHKDFTPDFPIRWKQVSSPDELADELIANDRRVAHGHFVYPTVTEFLWPACEKASIPFTFIAHAQDIFRHHNDERNRISEIVASPLCLRLFVLSSFHRDYVISRGVPAGKIVINPNAIDSSLFAGGSIPDRAARKHRAICAVHRYCEKKGLEHLIRAGAELARDGIQIDLYGYGPLEEQYQAIIDELRLTNVNLRGPVENREELLDVLRRYDLFACPSVRAEDGDMDGIPTSVAEAMAAGLPVLTTAISGIPELVTDGITGVVCDATSESIAATVRRYYTMPVEQVESMIEFARQRVARNHDVRRLARVLVRVWQQKTLDLIIVSWTHVDEHREVLRRLYEYTSLPFHVIVSINSDNPEVLGILDEYQTSKDNITLVRNGYNAMVGPGTNHAMDAGNSDIAIYVCGREGFALRPGWEIEFVHHMEEHPEVGLAGTLGHAPTHLTGAQYPDGISLFPKFRNREFAAANPDRIFKHVQGGLFAIRREMYEAIGGFSEEVPHAYTDTEYSFYAESCGWKLGEVASITSVFNKTRPPLAARIDESLKAAHPPKLEELNKLDRIVRGQSHCCNLCAWQGPSFNFGNGGEAACPNCGASPADRTLYRWLTPSIYLHRRLPAVAIGLSGEMDRIWSEHFQGPRLAAADFVKMAEAGERLSNGDGKLQLGVLRGGIENTGRWQRALSELARVLSPGAHLLVQRTSDVSGQDLDALATSAGFSVTTEARYGSQAVQFDWVPLYLWTRIA